MKTHEYKIFPIAEDALTVSFGNEISPEINDLVTQLASQIQKKPVPGFIECVPAYSSLTVFFDLVTSKQNFRGSLTAFEIIKNLIEIEIQSLTSGQREETRTLEIPVSFDEKHAIDLKFVADSNGLEVAEVKRIFLEKTYRVFMIGFLPGFPYMGKIDNRIATPRKKTPREKVKKGSVGIAGSQTGIYPLDSPGGWQIIGKTDLDLFTPGNDDSPSLLRQGDEIKFVEQ